MIPISIPQQVIDINRAREQFERLCEIGWDSFLSELPAESKRTPLPPASKFGLPAGVIRRGVNNDRYAAVIQENGKKRMIGTFDTPEQAHRAYVVAHIKHHREQSIYWTKRHEFIETH